MGLRRDFNLRRLERYLVLSQLTGVAAVLVLSKANTVAPTQQAPQDSARAALPLGMAALALDVRQPATAAALVPWLSRGQTLVLLGVRVHGVPDTTIRGRQRQVCGFT